MTDKEHLKHTEECIDMAFAISAIILIVVIIYAIVSEGNSPCVAW